MSEEFGRITDRIAAPVLARVPSPGWTLLFLPASALVVVLMAGVFELLVRGVGIWGINVPVAWGFAITNFVWWIGIGHAGTLISAILLLLHQQWRTSINRFAEAMTLFAVACAGMFPLLHLGRPWLFYWLFPYPAVTHVWPQFRSPLVWDFFAVSTYFTVSLLFWYLGLIPDLASIRDLSRRRASKIVYGILALGWRGSARHWRHYRVAYLILAGLAAPLVVSVHTVVSLDFAVAILPGWHSTIFPPYFVAGAIFSGFAMVIDLAIPLRTFYGLKDYVTQWHLDCMAKVMLATGLIVDYGYLMEAFNAWYTNNLYERYVQLDRAFGPYGWAYWTLIALNVCLNQTLWIKKVRATPWILWLVAFGLNTGMWFERFVIVVQSLHRDYMPSAWGMYWPTVWDFAVFFGTIGFFVFCFLLFIRYLPMISMAEMREEHQEALRGG